MQVFQVLEMFGCGTACVVSPVDRIVYKHGDHVDELKIPTMKQNPSVMQRLFKAVTDIQVCTIFFQLTIFSTISVVHFSTAGLQNPVGRGWYLSRFN